MKNKLKFNKKKHKYTINKKELVSVTTWIKQFFNEFDEDKVAKAIHYGLKKKGIKKGIREIKKEWKQKRLEGTKIHNEIEDYIKSNYVSASKYNSLSNKTKNAISLIEYYTALDYLTLMPELQIYDEELGLAGTIDLALFDDNEVIVIDWKTNDSLKKVGYNKSKHPLMKDEEDCNFTHYTLQLSVYAYMLERKGYKVNHLVLCHLKEDDYEVYLVEYRKDKVEEMLEWQKRQK